MTSKRLLADHHEVRSSFMISDKKMIRGYSRSRRGALMELLRSHRPRHETNEKWPQSDAELLQSRQGFTVERPRSHQGATAVPLQRWWWDPKESRHSIHRTTTIPLGCYGRIIEKLQLSHHGAESVHARNHRRATSESGRISAEPSRHRQVATANPPWSRDGATVEPRESCCGAFAKPPQRPRGDTPEPPQNFCGSPVNQQRSRRLTAANFTCSRGWAILESPRSHKEVTTKLQKSHSGADT